ncbi:MAG: outer membrane lipoprotein carrier protein LolA [Bacteroidota bacterium]|nr:outer membrane lipoprotein carrier protein LolA [Bacteroidota bacterium]MDP4205666.1 outer membrane lipoprotein carrier protein LolA [Bacteroidota bacterium]
MRKFLLVVSLLSVGLFTQAQQDYKAKALLDKVANKTKSYKSLEINFAFALANAKAKVNEKHEGKIFIKGSKYRLNLMGAETYFNGKTQWTYLHDANEVNISSSSDEGEAINPAKIFTIYQKGYSYKLKSTKKEGNRTISQVELTPYKVKDVKLIILDIDANALQIARAKMYSKDGNQYSLVMKNMKTNSNLADSYFEFDKKKHPKVSVNDMR